MLANAWGFSVVESTMQGGNSFGGTEVDDMCQNLREISHSSCQEYSPKYFYLSFVQDKRTI